VHLTGARCDWDHAMVALSQIESSRSHDMTARWCVFVRAEGVHRPARKHSRREKGLAMRLSLRPSTRHVALDLSEHPGSDSLA